VGADALARDAAGGVVGVESCPPQDAPTSERKQVDGPMHKNNLERPDIVESA